MKVYALDHGDRIELFTGYDFKVINKIYLLGYKDNYLGRIESLLNEQIGFSNENEKKIFIDTIKDLMRNYE